MEVSPADIRRAAMDLLARREHAQGELFQKLKKKFSGHLEQVEDEIERLRAEGLQSDTRLAEALIRSRAGRGQGPARIKSEMRMKHVSDDAMRLAFEQVDIDWFEVARTVHDKRFGEAPPADARERARRSRFLQQRGFSYEHISGLF